MKTQKHFSKQKTYRDVIKSINAIELQRVGVKTTDTLHHPAIVIAIYGVGKSGKTTFMNELSTMIFTNTGVSSIVKGSTSEIADALLNVDYKNHFADDLVVFLAEERSDDLIFEDQFSKLNYACKEANADEVLSIVIEPCPRIVAFALQDERKSAFQRGLSKLTFSFWEGNIMPLFNIGKYSYIDLMKEVIKRTTLRLDYIESSGAVAVITTNPLDRKSLMRSYELNS